jgi:hypothetical protein
MEEKAFSHKEIFKIEKIEPIEDSKKVAISKLIDTEEILPAKAKFDTALARADEVEKPAGKPVEPVAKSEGALLSPIEMSKGAKVERLEPATTERILDKAATIENKISTTKQQIETTLQHYPEIQISPDAHSKLSENLVHVDATLRSSLNTVGAEVTTLAIPSAAEVKSPLVSFLGYLTHGDKQMKSLISEVSGFGTKTELRPAQLLSIQVKLNFVQQEIEFFSSALNKALESAKTIMNVQI